MPLYLKDTEGRYQCLNRAFESFFAIRREDYLQRSLHDLMLPEDAAIHAGKDEELFRNGAARSMTPASPPATAPHDTIYRKAILRRPDGSVRGLLGTIIDITERKEAEAALMRWRWRRQRPPIARNLIFSPT